MAGGGLTYKLISAAHRDGSPYPLRTRHLSAPKEVVSGSCRISLSGSVFNPVEKTSSVLSVPL
jgi:hypothetical protein